MAGLDTVEHKRRCCLSPQHSMLCYEYLQEDRLCEHAAAAWSGRQGGLTGVVGGGVPRGNHAQCTCYWDFIGELVERDESTYSNELCRYQTIFCPYIGWMNETQLHIFEIGTYQWISCRHKVGYLIWIGISIAMKLICVCLKYRKNQYRKFKI